MIEGTSTYRNITYRLLPSSKAKAQKLIGLAGACRFVWNAMLAQQKETYKKTIEAGEDPPSVSHFSLNKRFTALRCRVEWLPQYSFKVVRYALKYQAEAWRAFFRGTRDMPKFHSRRRSPLSFTIPDGVKIKDNKLHIPKIGYMEIRRKGGTLYPNGDPVKAVVKQKAGKWYATICYKIEAPVIPDNCVAVGVDRNCGQIAIVSTEGDQAIISQPDTPRLDAKLKRYQRQLARQKRGSNRCQKTKLKIAKCQHKQSNIRRTVNHRASRKIASLGSTVVLEALKTKDMTSSAKGTIEQPGKRVKQKSGLNRSILQTGWHQLEQMLGYKCRELIKVPAAYTSQRCNRCGHTYAGNRKTQRKFSCMACGHSDNADLNAAANILASGIGAAARRGAFGLPTPKTREIDLECIA